jgi:hypothetical protein
LYYRNRIFDLNLDDPEISEGLDPEISEGLDPEISEGLDPEISKPNLEESAASESYDQYGNDHMEKFLVKKVHYRSYSYTNFPQ